MTSIDSLSASEPAHYTRAVKLARILPAQYSHLCASILHATRSLIDDLYLLWYSGVIAVRSSSTPSRAPGPVRAQPSTSTANAAKIDSSARSLLLNFAGAHTAANISIRKN